MQKEKKIHKYTTKCMSPAILIATDFILYFEKFLSALVKTKIIGCLVTNCISSYINKEQLMCQAFKLDVHTDVPTINTRAQVNAATVQ